MFLIVFCGGVLAVNEEKAIVVSEPVYECQDPDYQSFLQKNYILFEVGQVHPLESSVDGKWVFALNSPLGCLEIYRVENSRLQLASSVAVGIQPVSVRVRNSHEVWVVNHLSDNVSVVELSGRPRIKEILQVGDAPFDVAFAAKNKEGAATRAYISCSARGQNHPTFEAHNLVSNVIEYQEHGQLKNEKLGMADLWVYDINSSVEFEGIINPFMSDLRSLAVSEDGKTVYGAGFLSGNQTTSIPALPPPPETVSEENLVSIATAQIVKKQGDVWRDHEGNNFSNNVQIDLPDTDVISVDATRPPQPFREMGGRAITNTNRQLIKDVFSGMGAVLFSLAVDGDYLLLTALDSHNEIPLEENLVGKATSNMLVVQQGQHRERINLDKISSKSKSGSLPLPGAIYAGKKFVYVAGFGSSRIGFFKRQSTPKNFTLAGIIDLQSPASQASKSAKAGVDGMGVSGIAELPSGAVVVLSRMDNSLRVLQSDANKQEDFIAVQTLEMVTPETEDIVQGRRFLYDADVAGNGKMACGSCHVFGDWDGLAWNLGSKKRKLINNEKPFIYIQGALIENMANSIRALPIKLSPDDYKVGENIPVGRYKLPLCFKGSADELHKKLQEKMFGTKSCAHYVTEGATSSVSKDYHYDLMGHGNQWASINFPYFNSLKGPMRTQTLYGLAYGGSMHHQGDRKGDKPAVGNHCPEGYSLEDRAFKEFNQACDGGSSAFVDLLGGRQLQPEEMDLFSRFALRMHFPPNPHRSLDNYIPPEWEKMFSQDRIAKDITSFNALASGNKGVVSCAHCHVLDVSSGHFGTAGNHYYSAPPVSQDMDVPDFRTFYRKLGFYPKTYHRNPEGFMDNKQVSGFGYFHNASFDPVDAVFNKMFFQFPDDRIDSIDIRGRRNMFYYLSLFDTDVFPAGGQQRMAKDIAGSSFLKNKNHCNAYAFTNGRFSDDITKFDNSAILTCYPKLQARK